MFPERKSRETLRLKEKYFVLIYSNEEHNEKWTDKNSIIRRRVKCQKFYLWGIITNSYSGIRLSNYVIRKNGMILFSVYDSELDTKLF